MPKFPHSPSPKRIAVIALACASVFALLSFIAYSVAGADPVAKLGMRDNAEGNPNYPFPTDAHLAPTMKAIVNRAATRRATGATAVSRNPQLVNRSPPPTAPTSISPGNKTGIFPQPFPSDYGPIYNMAMTIENYYRTFDSPLRPNQLFVVVAGASRTDAQAGYIGVAIYEKTGLMSLNTSFTPTKHGSVHIIEVKNNVATLEAKDGTRFAFDFVAYRFV